VTQKVQKGTWTFPKHILSISSPTKAILMSTHNIFKAKEMADVIGIMIDGNWFLQKTKDEFEFDDLEKLYLDYMEGRLAGEE